MRKQLFSETSAASFLENFCAGKRDSDERCWIRGIGHSERRYITIYPYSHCFDGFRKCHPKSKNASPNDPFLINSSVFREKSMPQTAPARAHGRHADDGYIFCRWRDVTSPTNRAPRKSHPPISAVPSGATDFWDAATDFWDAATFRARARLKLFLLESKHGPTRPGLLLRTSTGPSSCFGRRSRTTRRTRESAARVVRRASCVVRVFR